MIIIKEISEKDVPMSMLLHADPSESCIAAYFPGAQCFGAFVHDSLVGVCVTNLNKSSVWEIFNIVVVPKWQQQGIGTRLLESVISHFRDSGEKSLELGTGTFGYQLLLYQRFGFRVVSIRENFFVDNYPEPIFEQGVQLRDMLRLRLTLQ